jgi:hypothetical protein
MNMAPQSDVVEDVAPLKSSSFWNVLEIPILRPFVGPGSGNILSLKFCGASLRAIQAIDAIEKYGVGSGSVRAIAGNMDIHIKLEERLAKIQNMQKRR